MTKTVEFFNESGGKEVLGTFDNVLIEGQEGGYLMTISAEAGVTRADWENALKWKTVAVREGHTAFYARSGYIEDITADRIEVGTIQAKQISVGSLNNFIYSATNPTAEDLAGRPDGSRWLTPNDEFIKIGEAWIDYNNRQAIFAGTEFIVANAISERTVFQLVTINNVQYKWSDFSETSLFGSSQTKVHTIATMTTQISAGRPERTVTEGKDDRTRVIPAVPPSYRTRRATVTLVKDGESGFIVTELSNPDNLPVSTATIPAITGTPV